jgi:PAS domain S-box-containing protein
MVYALSYSGRGTGLSRRRIAMLAGIALPALAASGVIALRPPESTLEAAIAGVLGWEILYLFTLFCYSTYLLVGLSRSHDRVSRTQILVLLAGVGAPYLVSVARDGGTPFDNVTVGLILSGTLLGVAIRRYPVLTGFPKANYVARSRVVEALQEAVVVLDWDDHVIDANAAAERLFGQSSPSIVDGPIRSVIDGLERTALSPGETETVTLDTTAGRRQFQFSVSAVDSAGTNDRGDPVARAVVFRDVTDRETREQRLAVLNRVLRHNVRNELDVVLAHAERIEDPDLRAGIRESANDLVTLSDKARAAEESMTASTEPPEPVDLVAVATSVADQYRTDELDGDITLDCPDELTVSTRRAVVRRVLSELVDNAITHASNSPGVEISVRRDAEDVVELRVADNGPGIPDRQQRILAEGDETQLEHGRGLGLWFVNWTVTQLGGDLEISENDPQGSVVTVRLYVADDPS